MSNLSHTDAAGQARMVDVSAKSETERVARAGGSIVMTAEALRAVRDNQIAKGDVLATARIAGIMAAKKTADLIPLCHPLPLASVTLTLTLDEPACVVRVVAEARTVARTGVEMEAMTAASVALLTIYDMVKAMDKGMRIESVRLLEKRGGKSGLWQAEPA